METKRHAFETTVKQRLIVPERMDDPQLSRAEHEHALNGLARLNRWSFGDSGLWASVCEEAKLVAPRPLRVLDLATGSGDLPLRLARRAQRAGVNLSIAACDISPTAIEVARQHAQKSRLSVEFFERDAVHQELPTDHDVIIASLFLHHLSEPYAIHLLQKMAEATNRVLLVNDLSRSRLNLVLVTLACHLLTRSRVVHFDGPTSVQAAFSIAEIKDLARRAGLVNAEVFARFPCRWLLRWRKPS